MLYAAIGLFFGNLLFQQLPSLPPSWIGPLILVPAALACRRYVGLSAVLLGFGWTWWHAADMLTGRLPDQLAGRTVVVEGRVHGLPEDRAGGQRFLLDVEGVESSETVVALPGWTGRVRLTWRSPPLPVRAGQRWRLAARLYAANGSRNPGGFDYERWLYAGGIGATGYVLDDPENERLQPDRLRSLNHRAREAVRDRVGQAGGSADATALFRALVIGDRSGFGDSHWEVFRATGTSHLVAISGLHLGLVAGLGYWVTHWLWRRSARLCLRVPAGYAGGLASLVVATAYALLAGFSLPTQRALVMLVAGVWALSLRRVVTPPGVLAIALAAVVLVDPNAVLGGGFWLSFAAVAVIFMVVSGRRATGPLGSWWRVQWGIALGLIPVLAAWGLPVAGVAPFVNLLAVPWFALVVVPLSFLCLLATLLLPAAGTGLLELDLWLLDQSFRALQAVADAPGWRWVPPVPAVPAVMLAVVAVPVLLLPLPLRYRAMGLLMFLPLVLGPGNDVPAGGLRVAMLDVGQGLSTVVRTENHTLVYDLGPRFSSGFNAAETVVVPFLATEGVDRVDLLMLSHDDADHAGAWRRFVDRVAVGELMAGQPERLAPGVRRCRRGDVWTWDGVRFEVLHPADSGTGGHDNNASCVLRILHPRAALLLTGDITRSAEQRLAAGAIGADFVVVPHHGSRSSSSEALVRASGARYALVSAGYRNRYGFPDAGVVERWRSAGVEVLNTADAGAVIIDVDAQGRTSVTRYRDAARRYWHR